MLLKRILLKSFKWHLYVRDVRYPDDKWSEVVVDSFPPITRFDSYGTWPWTIQIGKVNYDFDLDITRAMVICF
jgi:hypothetical protein